MKNKNRTTTLILLALSLLGLIAYLPLGSNLWHILTGKEYIIPDESSIFTFRPTVMNDGSGDWWLYGEDRNYYYHFIGSQDVPYLKISKTDADRCWGFVSRDHKTWCKD